ncbi:MAG: hypothetical protein ACK6AO_12485 [Planctomycetota bacterium]
MTRRSSKRSRASLRRGGALGRFVFSAPVRRIMDGSGRLGLLVLLDFVDNNG